tara:strand:- start:588 stop:1223 length:636 start_codon:yes stop_codon:yes gene_type:complete
MNIKLFASLKEKHGSDILVIDNGEIKTIKDLKIFIINNFDLEVENCMFACNLEYVDETFKLKNEHEISIIPPVSGGSTNDLVKITDKEILIENFNLKKTKYNGSELTFLGISRDVNDGKKVESLFYECFEEMAIKEIEKIINKLKIKYLIDYFIVVHRIGSVPPGETSLLVSVASEHRKQSLDCMTAFLDLFKEKVPIWKKEIYIDDSKWL